MGGSSNVDIPSDGDQFRNNLEAGVQQFLLNNPNTFTPFGNLTYSQVRDSEGRPVYAGTVNGYRVPRYQANYTLSQPLQQQLNQQNQINAGIGTATQGALDRTQQALSQPINLSGLPGLQGAASGGDIQRRIEAGRLPDVTGAGDFGRERQQIEGRIADIGRRRVDDRFRGEREQLEQRLANQGLAAGSEAYEDAIRRFDDTRNRAYQEANDSAFQGAGQEQSRLFGLNTGARQQLFGEASQQGNFANAAQQNAFQQSLSNANLGNQTRQQGLQEIAYLRDRPLQELQTLRGNLAAPSLPNFQPPQGSQVAPGNAFQAFQARQSNQQPSPFGQLLGVGGQIAGNLVGGGK